MKFSTLLRCLLCCTPLFFSLQAKLQIITTVAGNGSGGYSGNDGLALNAGMRPEGISVDSHGNVYIAEEYNNVVRKVNVVTGIITTVAGTAVGGFSGDGGPATQAQLNLPLNVTVDSSGNIYIVDSRNFRIRKVDGITGVITTLAGAGGDYFSGDGGPAVDANLLDPAGIALDATNKNLYITEAIGNRVRKIDLTNGIITTVAGDGHVTMPNGDGGLAINATINNPVALAVDTNNNVYISESGDFLIRKINASDGIINTIAGTGISGYAGDGGLAKNAEIGYIWGLAADKNGNLYLADNASFTIRKIDLTDSIITTAAGNTKYEYNGDGILATQANVGQPWGIAVDSKNNFYISQVSIDRIRKVTVDSSALDEVYGYAWHDLNSNNIKDPNETFFPAERLL